MYRALVMFPPSAGQAEVESLVEQIASSFKASGGCQQITRNVGSLMGPGAYSGRAGWILESDFATLEAALAALDADHFQEVKAIAEALTSDIFLFEIDEM